MTAHHEGRSNTKLTKSFLYRICIVAFVFFVTS
jgi:hypothetical protein